MKKIIEQIDQAMPPGGVLDVTLENIQNIASALVSARKCIVSQSQQMSFLEVQIREILIRRSEQHAKRECND
jgi:hypothetical protein